MTEPATGGCQCGGVRYEVTEAPIALYACHCRECQKQSGSAFGLSLIVPRGALRVTRGETKTWTRPTDSGGTLHCHFCPDCGSRLWHAAPARPDQVSLKAGSLDAPVDVANAVHIWVTRKLPGVVLPADAETFPEEPD